MSIPNACLRRPVTVLVSYLAIMIVGMISLFKLPVELMPNYSYGDISIFVDVRGGMPPQDIETLVAKPIEDAVGDVAHLTDVISISEEGRCRITLKLEPGVNVDYSALEVRERIARIKDQLPAECDRPVVAKFEQSDMPVLIVALASNSYSPEKLRRLVDDKIKDRIMRVEGVANVEVGGGRERKILIDVNAGNLAANNVSMSQLVAALGSNNLNLLVGQMEKEEKERYILRVTGEFVDIEAIKNLVISPNGAKVKDVALVRDDYLKASSFARVNNSPVVSLYIQKETSANTVKVCDGALAEIEKIKKDYNLSGKEGRFIITYNQAEAIRRAIQSVESSIIWGALLAALVLCFFLRDFRVISLIFLTIPVSIISTFAMMYLSPQKISLNIMTLSGLALGVGMLVDNSVVVLENIFSKRERKVPLYEAVSGGASEMILAIAASTLSSIVVFLPLAFVNTEIRIMYSGFALTIVFALLVSLAVAITFIPMVYFRLNSKSQESFGFGSYAGLVNLRKKYRGLLVKAMRSRLTMILGAAIAFLVCAVIFLKFMPKEFIGQAAQEDFTIFIELPTGAKLDISNSAVRDIEDILEGRPEIKTVSSRIEPWSSKIYVKLQPLSSRNKSTQQVIDSLRQPVSEVEKKYKEAFIYFEQSQSTESNEVLIEVYGYDYDTLNSLAVKMLGAMDKVKGLIDLKIRWRKGRPEWQVVPDKAKCAFYGLTISDVAESLHSQMRGLRATLYHTEGKEVEVVSRLSEDWRDTLYKLKKIPISLPGSGETIYLEQVATFVPQIGPGKIWRKNKNRMIQISANRGAYSFGKASDKIAQALKNVDFPKDYFWRFGENYWRMIENQRQLTFAFGLMLVLVFLVLASLFESYRKPFIIMASVPLAFIGAVLLLFISGKSINIGALMGLIILGGIVVNNSIVMVDHISRLSGRYKNYWRAVIKGSSDRLRPVLITSITTTLGMLPLALDRSEDSSLWSPLAITVIGGMISSTILTLFLIPCIYTLIYPDKKK